MAEVLPSSPHYVADGPVDERNKNFFSISPPQSRTSVFRVLNRSASRNPIDEQKVSMAVRGRRESGGVSTAFSICKGDTSVSEADSGNEGGNNDQPWIVAVLLTTFRRSLVSCRPNAREDRPNMEISWPTNVQHVAHVTFDRFNGFLGLPVEFEMEIPRRAPSASASVFGVSAESMQLSYDSRGNSVPTILLLMQERLYSQGGLRAEGIFRINAENSQEENVRDQLNKGIVPDDIDVHCLAGLIKAWFRELPTGVLDTLTPEQVLQCNEEKQCVELVKLLPPTEVALLNWAVNLMTDVVQEQEYNKMNARNIAMVFAPNMTQMSDPLTALMHAVQVMNFLKTLILKTLREREEAAGTPTLYCGYSNDEDSYDSTPQTSTAYRAMDVSDEDDHTLESGEYLMDSYSRSSDEDTPTMYTEDGFLSHMYVRDISDEESSRDSLFDIYDSSNVLNEVEQKILGKTAIFQFKKENGLLFLESPQERASTSEEDASLLAMDSSDKNLKTDVEELKANTKEHSQNVVQMIQAAVRTRGSVVNTIDQQIERVEAW